MNAQKNYQQVIENAYKYLAQEENPDYRRQTEELLRQVEQLKEERAFSELQDKFGSYLQFGTAGLRGKMEAGFMSMNKTTVAWAAWALAQHLLSEFSNKKELLKSKGVVIGYDARLRSKEFSEDVAEILTANGIAVKIFDTQVATPLCAYAVTHLQACAAIVVTASHNPPADNGIKVYWQNGAQITKPHTSQIAELISKAPEFKTIGRLKLAEQQAKNLREEIGESVFAAYFTALREGCVHDNSKVKTPLSIVYTAMHGVGGKFVLRALKEAGFDNVQVVLEQFEPDGTFPTVEFPNPEEEGALNLASALAKKCNADLILASDPDTDRLAVWAKKEGQLCALSGNEIGWLLGEDALKYSRAEKKLALTTVVSSGMLALIAAKYGATMCTTNTGFSHICKKAFEREQAHGEELIFAYEEALGYCVGSIVHDKDGISAALRFAELAAFLHRENSSISDELQRLAREYGIHKNAQWSVRISGHDSAGQMQALMQTMRNDYKNFALFSHFYLEKYEDLLLHPDQERRANMLIFHLENNIRLIVRPSGTEAKIKFYVEAIGTDEHQLVQKLVEIRTLIDQALAKK